MIDDYQQSAHYSTVETVDPSIRGVSEAQLDI